MANLNMAIAKTHRTGGQLVGLQLTTGNVIAIILSGVQMVSGAVVLTAPSLTGSLLFLLIPIALIFLAMAILIERLTVISLMSIRICIKNISEIGEAKYQEEIGENRDLVLKEMGRRIGKQVGSLIAMIPIALSGMGISAAVGDIFFHWIFQHLENGTLAVVLSFVCAGVISLSFVLSELFKDMTDAALRGTIEDTEISKTVLANEQENFNISLAVSSMDAINKDKTIQETVRTQIISQITPTLNENVSALFKQVKEEQALLLPSPEDREADQKLLEERLVTRITECLDARLEKQTETLPALPERAASNVATNEPTTGDFHTLDDPTQVLYRAIRAHEDIVIKLLSGESVAALVSYLHAEFPNDQATVTEGRVSAIVEVLRSEERDTDKLVSTDPQQDQQHAVVATPQTKAVVVKKTSTTPRKKINMATPPAAPRNKYTPQIEADLVGLLQVNPALTLGSIETRYGVTENTARGWKRRALTAISQAETA